MTKHYQIHVVDETGRAVAKFDCEDVYHAFWDLVQYGGIPQDVVDAVDESFDQIEWELGPEGKRYNEGVE